MKKKKVFVIFTDLDGTFIPMDENMMNDFVSLIKKIESRENLKVKFCAISGRPIDFVTEKTNEIEGILLKHGIKNAVDYDVGEQGAVMLEKKNPKSTTFLGKNTNRNIQNEVSDYLKRIGYGDFFIREKGKYFNSTLYLKQQYKESLTKVDKESLFLNIIDSINEKFKERVNINTWGNCIEIMPAEIDKGRALKRIFHGYLEKFNIVGMTYSGDGITDKSAIEFMSKMAEIKGIKTHVLLPSNCIKEIESDQIESWKNKFYESGSINRILKLNKKYYEGVISYLNNMLDNDNLVGTGCTLGRTNDDSNIIYASYNTKGNERIAKNKDTVLEM